MIALAIVLGYVLVGLMVGGGVARFLIGPDPRNPKDAWNKDDHILFSCIVGVFWPLAIIVGTVTVIAVGLWFPVILKGWWNQWHNSPEKVKARDERRERREVKRQVNQVAKEYKVKRFRLIRR